MKKAILGLLVLLALQNTVPQAAVSSRANSAAAERAIAESISAALQGDGNRARAALAAVPIEQFSTKDGVYRECMLARFAKNSADAAAGIDDPFVRDTLHAYQDYWQRALLAPARRDALAEELRQQMLALIGDTAAGVRDWDALEKSITAKLRERGYYAQLGYTPPLRELMIWRDQESKFHDVELPEGSHRVRVEMLDDFVALGWSSYARCGRGSNGGWVGEDRLFAVVPAFADEAGEDAFHASLLTHETQHFADLERFENLAAWELEYRAKLAELWAARATFSKLLDKFAGSQSDDQESPHTFANKRVMLALRARLERGGFGSLLPDLKNAPPDAVRQAALDELVQDSRKRAARTESVAESRDFH